MWNCVKYRASVVPLGERTEIEQLAFWGYTPGYPGLVMRPLVDTNSLLKSVLDNKLWTEIFANILHDVKVWKTSKTSLKNMYLS